MKVPKLRALAMITSVTAGTTGRSVAGVGLGMRSALALVDFHRRDPTCG
jgi:hypothetical protein